MNVDRLMQVAAAGYAADAPKRAKAGDERPAFVDLDDAAKAALVGVVRAIVAEKKPPCSPAFLAAVRAAIASR